MLGALIVALGDRVDASITRSSGLPTTTDRCRRCPLPRSARIDRLADVLGLTSSGTVRLVDRLEAAGLDAPVGRRRQPGDHRRALPERPAQGRR